MAFLSSSSPTMQKGIFVSVPVLVLSVSFAAAVIFLLSSSCSCPSSVSSPNDVGVSVSDVRLEERISPTREDIEWVRDLIRSNGLHMQKNELRKGINPRTRDQQLADLIQLVSPEYRAFDEILSCFCSVSSECRAFDEILSCFCSVSSGRSYDLSLVSPECRAFDEILSCSSAVLVSPKCLASDETLSCSALFIVVKYKGISHYEGEEEANNHTALPCPGELLVEQHHSNYGEPWAGGRDVFEFLAQSSNLKPNSRVLEIGCGTLRVGLHFIRYLNPTHFHCLEKDELSLMAALRYELPSQGLLHKRPLILRGDDMEFSKFGLDTSYDLIYASAVFLHMPDKLVWTGLERLVEKLKPYDGRIFVSHNVKFCSRLGGDECAKKLASLGLEYLGKQTHDSLLFNHYEIWFGFRRVKP
ncbi:hypothetical protein F2Q69_00032376 [Brassica cretica]|uniref:Methyltransferase type 12 domain-containing protein n=1 Tax=Brassica cretica TaxID=69181 RepID=A0A8S9S5V6_BRACR|nr:hypothetical protein F2Q69_00032376 [Brassica cretica]